MDNKLKILSDWEEMGDSHVASSKETPLREDAFEMDDQLKIELDCQTFQRNHARIGIGFSR